ncbi:MAG: NAD(P)/FAD-dependent oxidoreductase [Paracoccaceae bacterium]
MSDFIVVGGGIAGISAAARFSDHGSVTVLEMEHGLGYHASGRSAAMFEENYGLPSTVALNKASAAFLETENGGYLSPRGLMMVAGPDEEEEFQSDIEDLNLGRISVAQAIEMVPILHPDTVTMAAFHSDARDLDTDRLIQDFARRTRQNGGKILTRQTVVAINRNSGEWHVTTSSGETFTASHLVNAAGPWVDQIAEMAGIKPIEITPLRRSVARLPAPSGFDVSNWPMIMGVGETWYAKPDAGKLLVSPAEEDPSTPHDAFADDMVLAEGLARYEEKVTVPVTRVENNWAGLRSFSPDRALVLGPDPDEPSFIWSAAQGGYGFQTAPAASQLVADLTLGRRSALSPDVVAMLSPKRFR